MANERDTNNRHTLPIQPLQTTVHADGDDAHSPSADRSVRALLEKSSQCLSQVFASNYKPSPHGIDMPVEGVLPPWLRGALYRPVPSVFNISYSVALNDDEKETRWIHLSHYFDALSAMTCFEISQDGESLQYTAKPMARSLEQKITLSHCLPPYLQTWSTEHHASSWSSVAMRFDKPFGEKKFQTSDKVHCGAAVVHGFPVVMDRGSAPAQLACMPTFGPPVIQYVDIETMQPLRTVSLPRLNHHLRGYWMTPGWQHDRHEDQWFGCLLEVQMKWNGLHPLLQIVMAPAQATMDNLELMLSVPLRHMTFIHSFAVTKHFLIIPVFPFRPSSLTSTAQFALGASLLSCCSFDASAPTEFLVISRKRKCLMATFRYKAPAFGLHVSNAYEEGQGVVLDLAVYESAAILDHLKLDNLRKDPKQHSLPLPKSLLKRFRLQNVLSMEQAGSTSAQVVDVEEVEVLAPCFFELPSVNARFRGKKYRFAYGASQSVQALQMQGGVKLWDAIVKLDTSKKEIVATWSKIGCYTTEPLFVPNPNGSEEDDGVVLVQVFDTQGGQSKPVLNGDGDLSEEAPTSKKTKPCSFLMVLDAKSLKVKATAELPDAHELPSHPAGPISAMTAPSKVSVPVPPPSLSRGSFVFS